MNNGSKHRYFISLAYNGTSFHGWQVQNGERTVQGVINEALSTVLQESVNIVGCGRTDTGVHASEFYAHFETGDAILPDILENLPYKLNKMLGDEIAIYSVFPVCMETHARFDASSRTYKYRVMRVKDPFEADFSYYLHGKIDVELMNKACNILMEYEDFECFSKVKTQVNNFLCTIQYAEWEEENGMLIFTIKANRFLRNMVRAIVGTMLDIGFHKINLEDFRAIIESKDRSEAGYSVPAKGLFLTGVEYPEEVEIPNNK